MKSYFEENKNSLWKSICEIVDNDVKEWLNKYLEISVTSQMNINTAELLCTFNYKINGTPFIIMNVYGLDAASFSDYFEDSYNSVNIPNKNYESDEEWLKDFRTISKAITVSHRYAVMMEDSTLKLLKYEKCSVDKLHKILEAFDGEFGINYTYFEDAYGDIYYDQDEYLELCLLKLVYEQE